VVASEVLVVPHARDTAEVRIIFSYVVDGLPYESNQFRFGASGQGTTITAAQQVVGAYPQGSVVTVHYHPTDPGDAVLETGNGDYGYLFLVMGSAFLALGIIGWRFPWIVHLSHLPFPK
jgi:hypothetical protein